MSASSDPSPFPGTGRLLGLDYGTKRIGIAVSTPDRTIASPLENYTLRTPGLDARHIRELAIDWRIVGLIVGLPMHMSGDEGGKAREAREFGEWVGEVTGLPVRFWDERFSTAAAEVHLMELGLTKKQRKERLDKVAAQVILQSYLEQHKPSLPEPGTPS